MGPKNNLEWITVVPWNMGGGDKEADGDLPELKKGPGRQLTEEEKQDIMRDEAPQIIHRAHFWKADFDKHGHTDRCPGCSAILRGLHVQPHTAECRNRMETVLSSDIWTKNAKARMEERSARRKNSPNEVTDTAKRRKQEDQVMKEENPTNIAGLFDRYRAEHLNDREDIGGNAKRQKFEKSVLLREQASGSHQSTTYAVVGVEKISEGNVDPWEFLEAVGNDNNNSTQCLKPWESRGEEEFAWDDVNNIALPLELVKTARQEEMSHIEGKIFKVVKKSEPWRITGKASISTKWVNTDETHGIGVPVIWSKWVARDFKDPKEKDREDLFNATQPLEMMRFIMSRQATHRKDDRERKSMYLDIKKAHVLPLWEQDVYVELPGEAEVEDDECGKLIHWLYGCHLAAQAWEEHSSALLKNHGFKLLKSVQVAFVHETRDMSGVVHGDDFVWESVDEDLDWVQKLLEDKHELKNRGRLGFGPNDVRKIDTLGCVIEVTRGDHLTGHRRHFDLLQEYFGMDDKTKVLTKNGYEDGPEQVELRETELSMEECKAFRMIAARFNHMAQENPWLQFPAKKVCRNMAKLRASDFMKIRRLVRFLKSAGEIKFLYAWQNEDEACDITVLVDSDWAGNTKTRKSTSGGVLKVGKHVIRTWSLAQTTVAIEWRSRAHRDV